MASKIIMLIGAVLFIVGAFWLRVTFTFEGHVYSVILMLVGFFLVLALEVKKRKTKNKNSKECVNENNL